MKLTEEKIIELSEKIFRQKKGSIKRTTKLIEFANDSMDIMEFIATLKNQHKVEIKPDEISKFKNAQDIINYILKNQKSK